MDKNILKKDINLMNILAWIVGILLFIAGAGNIDKSFLGGIFMIIASLITIPTIHKFVQKKFNFSVSKTIKIIAVIVLLIISSIFLPKKIETIPSSQNDNVVESKDETKDLEVPTEQVNSNEVNTVTPEVKNTQEVKTATEEKTQTDSQYTYYSVSSVVDGDTLKINKDGSIVTLRLIGIDTPETVDPRKPVQCFGKEASNKAKELLTGKKVRIETDPTQGNLDKYGIRVF